MPNSHRIEKELDLCGQNDRLTIFTSHNFSTGDEGIYARVLNFINQGGGSSDPSHLQPLSPRSLPPGPDLYNSVHCIWYCVACEEDRQVHPLEKRFFNQVAAGLIAPHIPVVLLFTKYDLFVNQVELDWSRDAQERGLSKVAVTHILRDLTQKRFDKTIGRRWKEEALSGGSIPHVCVGSGQDVGDDDADVGDGDAGFERVAVTTLENLRDRNVKFAFATAQRNSAHIASMCKF